MNNLTRKVHRNVLTLTFWSLENDLCVSARIKRAVPAFHLSQTSSVAGFGICRSVSVHFVFNSSHSGSIKDCQSCGVAQQLVEFGLLILVSDKMVVKIDFGKSKCTTAIIGCCSSHPIRNTLVVVKVTIGVRTFSKVETRSIGKHILACRGFSHHFQHHLVGHRGRTSGFSCSSFTIQNLVAIKGISLELEKVVVRISSGSRCGSFQLMRC